MRLMGLLVQANNTGTNTTSIDNQLILINEVKYVLWMIIVLIVLYVSLSILLEWFRFRVEKQRYEILLKMEPTKLPLVFIEELRKFLEENREFLEPCKEPSPRKLTVMKRYFHPIRFRVNLVKVVTIGLMIIILIYLLVVLSST